MLANAVILCTRRIVTQHVDCLQIATSFYVHTACIGSTRWLWTCRHEVQDSVLCQTEARRQPNYQCTHSYQDTERILSTDRVQLAVEFCDDEEQRQGIMQCVQGQRYEVYQLQLVPVTNKQACDPRHE